MGEQKKILVPDRERECYMKFIHSVNKNIILNGFNGEFSFQQLQEITKSYSYDTLLLNAPYYILGDLTVSFEVLRAELRSVFINISDDFAQMTHKVSVNGKGISTSHVLPWLVTDIISSMNSDRYTASTAIPQIFNVLKPYNSEYWEHQKRICVRIFNKFVMRTYNTLKVVEGVE